MSAGLVWLKSFMPIYLRLMALMERQEKHKADTLGAGLGATERWENCEPFLLCLQAQDSLILGLSSLGEGHQFPAEFGFNLSVSIEPETCIL